MAADYQTPILFFSYIFLGVFVYIVYLYCPSEASTWYCVIPDGYPPQDWQSLPCAGEELDSDLDSDLGLLIWSQVRYHWATSPQTRILAWLCRKIDTEFGVKPAWH